MIHIATSEANEDRGKNSSGMYDREISNMICELPEWGRPVGKRLPANQPLDAAVLPKMKSLSCMSASHELLGAPEQRSAAV